MRLSWHLGFPHPHQWLDQLSARELSDVLAFAEREPYGEERADFRAGQQCLIAARAAGANAAKLTDFIPQWGDRDEAEQSREQMDEAMRKWAGVIEAQKTKRKRGK